MEDREIIDLYNSRDEAAIAQTDTKYGRDCRAVARSVLRQPEDAEEAVQDAYFGVWNAIPPTYPRSLRTFVCRVTRNVSLKKYDYINARRRAPECVSSLEELASCVSGRESVESELENRRVEEVIDGFLRGLGREKRYVFLRRYWYFDSLKAISGRTGWPVSKVANMLYRMRLKLRERLEREGIDL